MYVSRECGKTNKKTQSNLQSRSLFSIKQGLIWRET